MLKRLSKIPQFSKYFWEKISFSLSAKAKFSFLFRSRKYKKNKKQQTSKVVKRKQETTKQQ